MKKLRDTRVLTTAALLTAICTVLGFFKIPLTNLVELRFAFLPIAVSGALFGPGIGALVGTLSDILGYLVKPTGVFFPGFTLASLMNGVIYGFFFYKKELTLPRIIGAEAVRVVICNLLINTASLSILYHMPFWATLAGRLLKNAVMFPVNCLLLIVLLKPVFRYLPDSLQKG